MNTLRVNTIYPAFMGEVNTHGIGVSCTFVRLSGCNLRCYLKTKGVLCDTPEALSNKSGKNVSITDIIDEASSYGNEVICLTGGEPLMQDVEKLLKGFSKRGYHVVVETNGSKSILPYRHIRNVSFVVDVKSKSSGEDSLMLEENYCLLDKNDFVKFVIDTKDDYEEFRSWICEHDYLECNVAIGLFWGSEVSYEWLIDQLRYCAFDMPIYLNMQTHKMSCLYDATKDQDIFRKLFIPKNL